MAHRNSLPINSMVIFPLFWYVYQRVTQKDLHLQVSQARVRRRGPSSLWAFVVDPFGFRVET